MLATAVISTCAFALLMGLMALGVMVQGKRLAGSCGGNPESANCGCSPEKKAACKAQHNGGADSEEEEDVFSGPPLTDETLAGPGEERLIQLRTGRR